MCHAVAVRWPITQLLAIPTADLHSARIVVVCRLWYQKDFLTLATFADDLLSAGSVLVFVKDAVDLTVEDAASGTPSTLFPLCSSIAFEYVEGEEKQEKEDAKPSHRLPA